MIDCLLAAGTHPPRLWIRLLLLRRPHARETTIDIRDSIHLGIPYRNPIHWSGPVVQICWQTGKQGSGGLVHFLILNPQVAWRLLVELKAPDMGMGEPATTPMV
jgi:hypothetical protein